MADSIVDGRPNGSKTSRQVIDDICDDCQKYCTLREVLCIAGIMNDRTFEQFKCIDIFKYEQSTKEQVDIGWEEAAQRWVGLGHAAKFSRVYVAGLKAREIYDMVMERTTTLKLP
jgi:hypothetical protein